MTDDDKFVTASGSGALALSSLAAFVRQTNSTFSQHAFFWVSLGLVLFAVFADQILWYFM